MKKIILIIPLVLLLAGGVLLLRKRRQAIEHTPTASPITYQVRTVQPQTMTVVRKRAFLARLEPRTAAQIASRLTARIRAVEVRESDRVRRGELLVRLDDQDLQTSRRSLVAQREAAKQQLEYSAALHRRNQALFKVGGLAREQLEASKVALARARSSVRELEEKIAALDNQLDYANIRAPFAGTVGTIHLRQGDLASPGRTILTLNAPEQKLTFSFMPGRESIRPGQEVRFEGGSGKISRIYDDASHGLTVAEAIPDQEVPLPAASYLTISVVTGRMTGCGVPLAALLHRPGSTSVMVWQEDRFRERSVRITLQGREHALIDPCVDAPVAVAPEAKLSLLPARGRIRLAETGVDHE